MATTGISAPRAVQNEHVEKPTFSIPPQRPKTPEEYFRSPFCPSQHLAFKSMPPRITMLELGMPDRGISNIGVSHPFALFTAEAVRTMRNEVLSDEVWESCRFTSSIAACQLRGMAPKYAKFVYDAWTNPETLGIISKIAGVDLVPAMDYEIGHVNVSVRDGEPGEAKGAPVVDWHFDSYPFVCVLMLSDASQMLGGETAICTGTGEIIKVRGPQIGSAVVLQGRYLKHIALPATNCRERITMVTSFRPKSPALRDDSTLLTVRPVSDLEALYSQWTEYRLEIAEESCRGIVKALQARKRVGRKFDVGGMREGLSALVKFLVDTQKELVDPGVDEDEEEKASEVAGQAPAAKRNRTG